jgi:hypothetical protein
MKASSLLARQPQPILDHPPAQRLSRDLDSVLLERNLRCPRPLIVTKPNLCLRTSSSEG